jgi:hypothetical protein
MTTATITALLRERESCLRRGLTKRVADVDTALAALGYRTPVEAPSLYIQPIETAEESRPIETAIKRVVKKTKRG